MTDEQKQQVRERIGARIAELRKQAEWTDESGVLCKGMTQRQLAERAGIRQSNLSRIECGFYSPTIDMVSTIASAMGCKLEIINK